MQSYVGVEAVREDRRSGAQHDVHQMGLMAHADLFVLERICADEGKKRAKWSFLSIHQQLKPTERFGENDNEQRTLSEIRWPFR